jgi:hypothetical protein
LTKDYSATEKQALDWNTQGQRKKRKVEKELDKNDKKRKLKSFERLGDSSRQKQGSDGVDSWRPCVRKWSNRKLV